MTANENNVILGEDGKPLSKGALKKLEKQREKEAKKAEVAARLEAERIARESSQMDCSVGRYGKLPMNQSKEKTNTVFIDIDHLGPEHADKTVTLKARVQTSRPTGSKMVFFVLRQGIVTAQSLVCVDNSIVSKQMLKFANSITTESLVQIEAIVTKSPDLIKSCSVQEYELKIQKLFVVSEAERLPFSLEDAARPIADITEGSGFSPINLVTRLDNRIVDLRTPANQAIFRIQAGVSKFFRSFLDARNFTEIHTPKLIGAASEGGANVFKVTYFDKPAFLAQSPQLYKQMMVCAGFERVYEIAPVFRAEDSNTHRHMTEFMGLDMEMAFNEHYHEVMELLGDLFVRIFNGLKSEFAKEIATINAQYPFPEFKYPQKTLVLKFPEAVKMLRDHGEEIGDFDDLSTALERTLGKLVKEKYNTDFYVLDKFPLAVRPFYTMPDPNMPGYSNSYDFFMRGEEIMSGAQRVHDAEFLTKRAIEFGVDLKTIQPYLDAFKFGVSPHAGGGVGLERVVMLYLNLGNIRKTCLFPRDPKRLEP
ncbi:hypothetical protein BC833DRAFT_616574 [Globomyces pollinis-pini]|nr:hypothetical protein BC833DRAFT_616574 [Globomyces pollinis-pini]